MTRSEKSQGIVLLLVALVSFVFIATRIPGQFDWTAGNYYTLSPASKKLVKDLEEPIELKFYFSRSIEQLPVSIKNYGTLVEDLLRQYVSASDGGLTLQVIDPKPDTDVEEEAIRAGIQNQQIPTTGENVFFGLAVTCADQTEVLPNFTPDRESYLEYDVSQLIYRVQMLEKPVLGVITQLEIFGSQPPMSMPGMPPQGQGSPPWAVLSQLESTFEVREITGEDLPGDLTALALIHPGELSPNLKYAIDQFLLSGKPVFAAVDPSSYQQRSQQNARQRMMMGQGMPSASSDLSGLLASWGIEYNASVVVGDEALGTSVSAGGPPVRYPYWMTIRDFAKDNPLTAQLKEVWVLEGGSFQLAPDSALKLEPLIETTKESGSGDATSLAFQPPSAVAQSFKSDGEKRIVAGLIRGSFKTAFPDGQPVAPPAEAEEGEEAPTPPPSEPTGITEGEGTLLLVADSDFLTDQMSVRRVNFLGMNAVTPLNNNFDFALNALDGLAGNEALLSLRGKGEIRRGFDRIEKMERIAQEKFQTRMDEVQAKLKEVQTQLREMQQSQSGPQLVASPEVMQSIADYQAQEANLRSELREIRRVLRQDIERERAKLGMINVIFIPLIALAIGVFSHLGRARARR